jgi:hypothetical protein
MRGRLRMELRAGGEVLAVREGCNAVMRTGGDLVAHLFAGQGAPITHMAVGTDDTPEGGDFATAALKNEAVGELPPLQGATDAAIAAEAFAFETDTARRVVKVRFRATLPANAAVGVVREAGLLSRGPAGDTLYNRITFAPITKGDDHELTMFWEVSFPYGDLAWMP